MALIRISSQRCRFQPQIHGRSEKCNVVFSEKSFNQCFSRVGRVASGSVITSPSKSLTDLEPSHIIIQAAHDKKGFVSESLKIILGSYLQITIFNVFVFSGYSCV